MSAPVTAGLLAASISGAAENAIRCQYSIAQQPKELQQSFIVPWAQEFERSIAEALVALENGEKLNLVARFAECNWIARDAVNRSRMTTLEDPDQLKLL